VYDALHPKMLLGGTSQTNLASIINAKDLDTGGCFGVWGWPSYKRAVMNCIQNVWGLESVYEKAYAHADGKSMCACIYGCSVADTANSLDGFCFSGKTTS
jgi:hypothetical protein